MIPRTTLIFITKCLILVSLQETMSEDPGTQKLKAELVLDDLELVDICENIANAKRTAYLNENYDDKIKQEQAYGAMIKDHCDVLKDFREVATELERNCTFQTKPGDGLLPVEKWNQLVLYKNKLEKNANRMKLWQLNSSSIALVARKDYQRILSTERAVGYHNSTWTGWQDIYHASDITAFPKHIQLIREAALLNGFESVQEYWEELTDFKGGYSHAGQFWEEISPFYKRLIGFVRTRLYKYYNLDATQKTDEIPVYLLGFPFGSDWSNIADIVLPHPQLHYDVESYLKYKNVIEIYNYSENVVKSMGLGSLGNKFWEKSKFNAHGCGPEVFEFCESGYTGISECNEPSWKLYLDAHETALKIALNNVDYLGLTRQNLRFSGVDNAIETLGSLLAIDSLLYHGIINENVFDSEENSANMTKLLLTALRIMPRLSYYYMADKWRMEAIEQNDTIIIRKYWKFRKGYNGVRGNTQIEPEYMDDTHILANKPYISKFFGNLVAFQLFEYYREKSESSTNIVEEFGKDETFMALIKERPTADWPYLLNFHYGLDVSTEALLKYFEPLEQYLETAPVEQVPIVTTTTTTTTTTTSTTTTTTTTTAKPIAIVSDSGLNNLNDAILSDEPKLNVTNATGSNNAEDSHVGMWVGVSLLVIVACSLVAGYGYKTLRKRKRTTNRRFET